MVTNAIDQLVKYGMEKHLIQPADEIFVRNQLLLTMGLDEYAPSEDATPLALHEMLEVLTQNAVERGHLPGQRHRTGAVRYQADGLRDPLAQCGAPHL